MMVTKSGSGAGPPTSDSVTSFSIPYPPRELGSFKRPSATLVSGYNSSRGIVITKTATGHFPRLHHIGRGSLSPSYRRSTHKERWVVKRQLTTCVTWSPPNLSGEKWALNGYTSHGWAHASHVHKPRVKVVHVHRFASDKLVHPSPVKIHPSQSCIGLHPIRLGGRDCYAYPTRDCCGEQVLYD